MTCGRPRRGSKRRTLPRRRRHATTRSPRPTPMTLPSNAPRLCDATPTLFKSIAVACSSIARSGPTMPPMAMNADRPTMTSVISARRSPPPARARFLLAQPPASTMPKPNISPPAMCPTQFSDAPRYIDWPRSTTPARLQELRADQCRRRGKDPGTKSTPVAEGHDIRNGPHGAEVGPIDDRAEREADGETGDCQPSGSCLDHRVTQSGHPTSPHFDQARISHMRRQFSHET